MYFLCQYLDNKNSLWYYISGEIDRKPAKKKSSPKWDLLQGNLAEGGEKEVQHK